MKPESARAGRAGIMGGAALKLLVPALIVLAATLAPAEQEQALTTEQVIKRWVEGPARYIMSWKEDEAVREMKTVPELAQFMTNFWLKRDPSPGTIENELRRTFWQRALDANLRFRDSTVPGWKTDRGKIFILLGEPEQIVHTTASTGTGADARYRRDLERWIYKRTYSRIADPEYVVAFERDASMDWKLSSDPLLYDKTFSGDLSPSQATWFDTAALLASPPSVDTSVLARWDLGVEETIASTAEAVFAVVTTQEFVPAFSAIPKFEFFRAADGSTFVNVGCLVGARDLYGERTTGTTTLRVYARLAPLDEPDHPYYATNESHPAVLDLSKGIEAGGFVNVWTGLAVPPGRYKITIAVEDTLTARVGRISTEFDVPSLKDEVISLSTLVLASSLSQSEGRLGVKARSSAMFHRSETFGVYYEVYGLTAGARGPRFEVSYQFYRDRGAESAPSKLGRPVELKARTEAVQAWTFPLSEWPAGRYRLKVTVTDRSGRTGSAQASFEVIE